MINVNRAGFYIELEFLLILGTEAAFKRGFRAVAVYGNGAHGIGGGGAGVGFHHGEGSGRCSIEGEVILLQGAASGHLEIGLAVFAFGICLDCEVLKGDFKSRKFRSGGAALSELCLPNVAGEGPGGVLHAFAGRLGRLVSAGLVGAGLVSAGLIRGLLFFASCQHCPHGKD